MVESLIYSSNFFLILHGFKFYTVLCILLYLSFYLVFWPNSTAKLWHTYIKYIYIYTLRIYMYFLIILNEPNNNYEVLMQSKKLIHKLFTLFKFNFSLHFQLQQFLGVLEIQFQPQAKLSHVTHCSQKWQFNMINTINNIVFTITVNTGFYMMFKNVSINLNKVAKPIY